MVDDNNLEGLKTFSQLDEEDFETHKIFAGGLNRSTTADGLKLYFSKFGEVSHTEIVTDKTTGRSRGFGFVSFTSEDTLKKVLKVSHKVDNVVIDVKQAVRKDKAKNLAPAKDETNRIFVGGISDNITDEYFKEYFSRYGPIVSYNYLCDKVTNKPRGFGFVVYESYKDVEKVIGPHTSLGRNCEAKRAQPRPTNTAVNNNVQGMPIPGMMDSNRMDGGQEGIDYSSYYYAQANMLYNPYFAQFYNNGQMAPMMYFDQNTGMPILPFNNNWVQPVQTEDNTTHEPVDGEEDDDDDEEEEEDDEEDEEADDRKKGKIPPSIMAPIDSKVKNINLDH